MKAYLEPGEVKRLEDATTNLRDKLLVRILFHLGCRISEALGITVEDIDLAHGTIIIQHLKTRIQITCPDCNTKLGRSHTYCPKCGAKVEKAVAEALQHRRIRTLPVNYQTIELLKEYISRSGPVSQRGEMAHDAC